MKRYLLMTHAVFFLYGGFLGSYLLAGSLGAGSKLVLVLGNNSLGTSGGIGHKYCRFRIPENSSTDRWLMTNSSFFTCHR